MVTMPQLRLQQVTRVQGPFRMQRHSCMLAWSGCYQLCWHAGPKRRIQPSLVAPSATAACKQEQQAEQAQQTEPAFEQNLDDAAVEEYWEDYIQGKMDLVYNILQVRRCLF